MSDPLTICPWCREPVLDDDTIQSRDGVVWHAACKDRYDTAKRRSTKPRLLAHNTTTRARWFRDLCLACPHTSALEATLTKNDCMAIAEALDYAVRMSARQWKPKS